MILHLMNRKQRKGFFFCPQYIGNCSTVDDHQIQTQQGCALQPFGHCSEWQIQKYNRNTTKNTVVHIVLFGHWSLWWFSGWVTCLLPRPPLLYKCTIVLHSSNKLYLNLLFTPPSTKTKKNISLLNSLGRIERQYSTEHLTSWNKQLSLLVTLASSIKRRGLWCLQLNCSLKKSCVIFRVYCAVFRVWEGCRASEAGLSVRHYLITGIDKSKETAGDAFFTRLSFHGPVQSPVVHQLYFELYCISLTKSVLMNWSYPIDKASYSDYVFGIWGGV